jgi:hypothetical protein
LLAAAPGIKKAAMKPFWGVFADREESIFTLRFSLDPLILCLYIAVFKSNEIGEICF